MTHGKMLVMLRDVAELRFFPGNAKLHTEEQIEHIAKSIKDFGFTQPLVIDEEKVVLCGNGRLMAARHLKLHEVPTVMVKGLSEEKKLALNVADNKIQHETGWDLDLLREQAHGLEEVGIDLKEYGTVVPPLEDDEYRIENPTEKDGGAIKQFGAYFPVAQFNEVVQRFERIAEKDSLSDNTAVLLRLLDHYEDVRG